MQSKPYQEPGEYHTMDEKRQSTDVKKETNQTLELPNKDLKVAVIKALKQAIKSSLIMNEKKKTNRKSQQRKYQKGTKWKLLN